MMPGGWCIRTILWGACLGGAALANAERDVDDYRLTSEERYRDLNAPQ